ncbi:MAG: sulfite exporter TauE/SafE family protein, partial [Anaerolineaceae bacterium]|nr:sulfite exporter TauE/SafE family protein [Anaerolineaceae bacterium]
MSGTLLYAFLTGITTGGLSCYAVQGGLLTGAVARTVEKRTHKRNRMANLHQPILLFLFAKLLIHALLGFLLGMVGTAFKLTPFTQGLFQLAIGVFMVGNGLRLLNVSPIFRYFTFEPPRSLTRFIRRKSKDNQEWTTPALLGILTILIPCGITQVMMATAMGAKSPAEGAGILAAFVLGTTPVFFLATYSAVQIGAMFEKHFIRFIAVAILIFGFISVDTGLNLVGSPFSASRLWLRLKGETPAVV